MKINRLLVPKIVREGNPAELDCDFTLAEYDQDLVVKWFHNQTLVYQWIPGEFTKANKPSTAVAKIVLLIVVKKLPNIILIYLHNRRANIQDPHLSLSINLYLYLTLFLYVPSFYFSLFLSLLSPSLHFPLFLFSLFTFLCLLTCLCFPLTSYPRCCNLREKCPLLILPNSLPLSFFLLLLTSFRCRSPSTFLERKSETEMRN